MQKRTKAFRKPEIYDYVISLGGFCQVAYQLERLNLRSASFPFDWLFSLDVERMIEALENDFADFLKFENLVESPNASMSQHKYVTDSRYNMVHQHIFPQDISLEQSYGEIYRTVKRRIERFLQLQNKGLRLLFIRTNLDYEQCKRLGKVIKNKFGSGATLLVVNHSRDFEIKKIKSNLKNVRIVQIYDENENNPGDRWEGHDLHWSALLEHVEVRTSCADMNDESLFDGYYSCEKTPKGERFRWTGKNGKKSILKLSKYGGTVCELMVSASVKMRLLVKDMGGRCIFEGDVSDGVSIKFPVTHETRSIIMETECTWKPCDYFPPSGDDRELGVRLEKIIIRR